MVGGRVMSSVHLICGFMGTGKTTIARRLAMQMNAVRLTHNEFMTDLYGADIPESEFQSKWDKVDKLIWNLAEQIVCAGGNVILDYGFWSRESRQKAVERAKIFCDNITFHQVECDFETAKQRLRERDAGRLDEETFDALAKKYEPVGTDERFDVIYYRNV